MRITITNGEESKWKKDPEVEQEIITVPSMVPEYEVIAAVGQLIEMALCQHNAIPEHEIELFTSEFKHRKARHEVGPTDDAGDEMEAPHYMAHQAACFIERQLAVLLGVDWQKYTASCHKKVV